MRRWFFVAGLILMVLVGAIVPAAAQDSAADRILAAYQGYESWGSYKATVSETSSYALTAEGYQTSFWERQNRRSRVTAWYDQSDPANSVVSVNVNSSAQASTDLNDELTPFSWSVNLEAALNNGVLNWRGTYQSDPADTFALPTDWAEFTTQEISQTRALSDLALTRYLRQENADPFVGDYAAWLDSAVSIDGPETFSINRSTRADRYTVELNPDDVPGLIDSGVHLLSAEDTVLNNTDALFDALYDNSRIVWYVLLDPATGRLMGQQIQVTLAADLGSGTLKQPYSSLNFSGSTDQSVVFTNINEGVPANLLPPP
jgi:hypothetical protein